MQYRLGLDIGTNSLGWSVIRLDESGSDPEKIVDAGVRIFSDGRQPKSKATLKADRGLARSARRRHDRYKQRRKYLLSELIDKNLFPESKSERLSLQKLDPLELRAKALIEPLTPYQLGRSLFHLNQRRGFKSNRKDAESRDGVVRESIEKLNTQLNEAGCETLGQFLWTRRKRNLTTRARRYGEKANDLYEFYPSRDLLESEYDLIWDRQQQHNRELLTNELKEHFKKIIFWQRPLKPAKLGNCSFFPEETRTYRGIPSFQRYRLFQEINNLEWTTSEGTFCMTDVPQARDLAIQILEQPDVKNGLIVFSKIKRIVKELGLAEGDFEFNLESSKRKGLDGNQTSLIFQQEDHVGPSWHEWPLEKQDDFVFSILDSTKSDEEVREKLQNQYGLDQLQAENCLNSNLQDGAAQLSLKAARVLTEKMDDSMLKLHDAIITAADEDSRFKNPYVRAKEGGLLDNLPYYGMAINGHIIPGTNRPEDNEQDRIGKVPNPTVHIALNQIRRVVNELISQYGHPTSIAIELGRNLPEGAEGRRRIEKEQKENQEKNESLRNELAEQGQPTNRENLIRLKLWKELAKDPMERRCPFSGKLIGIADLFNGKAQIEHLIPFSISLDDSFANKVLCTRKANMDKGNKTPYEAFGGSPSGYIWEEIFERALNLPKPKQWRFQENAREIWFRDHDNFLARHLNDTRYIGRLTREYLENICPFNKIDVVTGRLTALLRGHWGLNSVLNLDAGKKNRNDHRHHAVDAIVVGMTSRSILQQISRAANRAEELDLEKIFQNKDAIDPWPDFRSSVQNAVNDIIVSHKPFRKKQGQLHNDTCYGIVSGPDEKGRSVVVTRSPVDNIKTEKHIDGIRDRYHRKQLLRSFKRSGIDGVKSYFSRKGIKSIRTTETLSVIPILDSDNGPYKAFKGDSNWAMEIFEYPKGSQKEGKWEGMMITRFEANQEHFQPGQSKKPHPAAKLVMRLHINDSLLIPASEGNYFYRVQRLSDGMITLSPINEANVDSRNRDKEDSFRFIYKSPDKLRQAGAYKAHISPSGKIFA